MNIARAGPRLGAVVDDFKVEIHTVVTAVEHPRGHHLYAIFDPIQRHLDRVLSFGQLIPIGIELPHRGVVRCGDTGTNQARLGHIQLRQLLDQKREWRVGLINRHGVVFQAQVDQGAAVGIDVHTQHISGHGDAPRSGHLWCRGLGVACGSVNHAWKVRQIVRGSRRIWA